MIKKLKIGLLIMVLSLAVGVGSVANAADLTWSADQTVSLDGSINLTILSGSTATSIAVAATTLTVVVPASSTFGLISPQRYLLTNDIGIAQTCNNTQNSVTVTGAQTVIFTPAATLCSFGGGGGLNSGGGGSSSSTVAQSSTPVTLTITPATSTTPATTMTTSTPGCSGGNKYNTSTGALCVNNAVVANNIPGCGSGTSGFSTASGVSCAGNVVGSSVSAAAGSYNLGTKTLKSGSKGDAVKELQRFLNDKLNLGLVVDGKLGPKTIAVIKKWQKDNGLVVDGLIGPKTKAKMNAQ